MQSAEKAAPKNATNAQPPKPATPATATVPAPAPTPGPTPAPVSEAATLDNTAMTELASTAPKLKLKLASQPTQNDESTKPPPKPRKARKMRATDMPPPPYIDDGSADLLQEVIAIEELGKSPNKYVNSKPRKVVELDADEELLSLASAEPQATLERSDTVEKNHPPAPPPLMPAPSPAPALIPPKVKKPIERPIQPSPSVKGKEKEAERPPLPAFQPASVTPSRPNRSASATPSAAATTPINEVKCREVLKTLMNMSQSFIFREPVDPVRDGCPTYVPE